MRTLWSFSWCLRCVIIVLAELWSCHGARPKLPITPARAEHEVLRGGASAVGCSFGGRFYALKESWNPDLGDPFGVMPCVNCFCEPVHHRRGKLYGKVSCQNMKHACPRLACADSIVRPGDCCKTCLEGSIFQKSHRPDVLDKKSFRFSPIQRAPSELEKSYNDRSYSNAENIPSHRHGTEFVALLTGSTSSRTRDGVARADIRLTGEALVFSLRYMTSSRPDSMRFMDPYGASLFDFRITSESRQGNMVCGEWQRPPQQVLHLLHAGRLYMGLGSAHRSVAELQGRLMLHRALTAETFSVLLVPSRQALHAGGLAMLTLEDNADHLHFVLVSQGLLLPADGTVRVQVLLLREGKVLRHTQANVTAHEPDVAEVWTDLEEQDLSALAQGELWLALEAAGGRRIAGPITSKKSCSALLCLLSGNEALVPKKTGAAGWAKFSVQDDGSVQYKMNVVGLSGTSSVAVEMKPQRRLHRIVVQSLRADFQQGQVKGMWKVLAARDLHRLMAAELFLSVISDSGELRGQIAPHLPPSSATESPVLLAGMRSRPLVHSGAASLAWLWLGPNCSLHYSAWAAGLSGGWHGDQAAGLELVSGRKEVTLRSFDGNQVHGELARLEESMLKHLDNGSAVLRLTTKTHPHGEVQSRVRVPNMCWLPEQQMAMPSQSSPMDNSLENVMCMFEGRQHSHGERWKPNYDPNCVNCLCQQGTVVCDPVACPPVHCTRRTIPHGTCCPVCLGDPKSVFESHRNSSQQNGCYFEGDDRLHAVGSSWHPLVPPFGYITCAVCTCKGSPPEVQCERVRCPHLSCTKPVRKHPSDCCRHCPAPERHFGAGSLLGSREGHGSEAQLMQADGPRPKPCRVAGASQPSGARWRPALPSGVVHCILCTCNDGIVHCERQSCDVKACRSADSPHDPCCSRCPDSAQDLYGPKEKFHLQ
uniref:chordin-like isoform X2 n=1 Tax=Myxine glutinosa TaxID=7769 RepID=UPI00358E6BBE